VERLQDRRSLLKLLDGQARRAELAAAQGLDTYQERAFSMLCSPQVKSAFDIQQEPGKVRDDYGRTTFGQCCLLARRLVERGVRLVTVFYSQPSGGFIWDTHKDHFSTNKQTLLPVTDQAVPALLNDLDQRGLLRETLVVWTGEFGRTPTGQNGKGRDHSPRGFSTWLAGGGVRGGQVVGATDDFGYAAVENKVHVHDLHATILHLMGLEHTLLTYFHGGRDHRLTDVSGRVVKELLV
jgi:uncharacterized protein (DUF1501 family)